VLIHLDEGPVESWVAEGSGVKIVRQFADFEPQYSLMPRRLLFQCC